MLARAGARATASSASRETADVPRGAHARPDRRTRPSYYASRCRDRRGRFRGRERRAPPSPVILEAEDANAAAGPTPPSLAPSGSGRFPRRVAEAVASTSAELSLPEPDVWARVEMLETHVPGLVTDSLVAKGPNAKILVRLAVGDGARTVANALALRDAFPTADVARMAGRAPGILAAPTRDLARAAERTKALLASLDDDDDDDDDGYSAGYSASASSASSEAEERRSAGAGRDGAGAGVDTGKLVTNKKVFISSKEFGERSSRRAPPAAVAGGVDATVQRNPALLDVHLLEAALETLEDAMPGTDPAKTLRRNPSMLFVNSERREGYVD